MPQFYSGRGLSSEEIGLALGAGTAVRLLTAPLAGRIGDLIQSLRLVLVVCLTAAAAVTLGYLPAYGFSAVFTLALLQAAALGPIGVLADALAVRQRFEYGWARGTGSAAFIVGTLISGQLVGALTLDIIVWQQATLLGVAALAALFVPEFAHERLAPSARAPTTGVLVLFRIPLFRNLVILAALILGSHAMHDTFAMIRWSSAGITPAIGSVLWSESVAAEVLVFFLIGPAMIRRLTPAGAIALAAIAGIVRWIVMAQTTHLLALALIQPLHGITFALLHLACMRLIARVVPPGLEGTAQAIYGTVGIGGATALLTFASGALYAHLGARGFWVMAALCAAALPLAWRLKLFDTAVVAPGVGRNP
jgi:PPP family 3-phenylpropionic acid transporter